MIPTAGPSPRSAADSDSPVVVGQRGDVEHGRRSPASPEGPDRGSRFGVRGRGQKVARTLDSSASRSIDAGQGERGAVPACRPALPTHRCIACAIGGGRGLVRR